MDFSFHAVLATIYFNDKPSAMTTKVSDKIANRRLSPKVQTTRLKRTKIGPEALFRLGGVFPQLPGEND